ncbi:hypothetical protein [Vibrio sp. H11]|uniref:hypothetical protein n=1 Tax=Vibrio sp. H11 TaxID=2565928 RepID=UPI0010A5F5D4|nr:hypothetical protein [Vibrio sp. H11]
MPENQNSLITGDLSCTIRNLDEFLRFLCLASEDEDACSPGMGHSLRLAQGAANWVRQEINIAEQSVILRDQSNKI